MLCLAKICLGLACGSSSELLLFKFSCCEIWIYAAGSLLIVYVLAVIGNFEASIGMIPIHDKTWQSAFPNLGLTQDSKSTSPIA